VPPAIDTIAAPGSVDNLILDLLEWIARDPRPYAEVLDAWRTSCPRLPVWEDANDRGFMMRRRSPARGVLVALSAAGAEHLRNHRPTPRDRPSPETTAAPRSRPTYRVDSANANSAQSCR
jgi:hypothetical protein